MGIFSKIKERLFGTAIEATPADTLIAEGVKPATADVAATPTASNEAIVTPTTTPADQTLVPASASEPVDVAAILDEAVRKNGQKLDWRHSIVDLMKALDMDASLQERKELADELGYTGDKSDLATMNIWLHKALLKALSDNGGKVPAELLD